MEDAGIPQERAKPEGKTKINAYHDLSSIIIYIIAYRHCAQGSEEHSESTLLYLWQVQVSFPATATATPTNHAH